MRWILMRFIKSKFNNLNFKISRILSKRLLSLKSLTPYTASLFIKTNYSYSRKLQKVFNIFVSIIVKEIKAQQSNLAEVSQLQENFRKQKWVITKQNTLIYLTKTNGKYSIRLLSNIKSPSNFDQGEEGKEQNQQKKKQAPYNGDINQFTISVTKAGSEKTMVVNTIVNQGFEISSINFSQNYQYAKQHRLDMFSRNNYIGSQMETLFDQMFDVIYAFLEQLCKIDNQLLTYVADYCIDSEPQFFINWLQDLKNTL